MKDGLQEHIESKLKNGVAINHYLHARNATLKLREMIRDDINGLKQFESKDDFRFFFAMSQEIVDGYGRILCFLHPNEPETKRDKRRKKEEEATGTVSSEERMPELDQLEERLCLICLRYFRGNWDLYQDYLAGPRVPPDQRREELPLVQKLSEMDRRTNFLEEILLDEVQASTEHVDFEGLYRLWEICMLMDPEADPFHQPEAGDEGEGQEGWPPPSMH